MWDVYFHQHVWALERFITAILFLQYDTTRHRWIRHHKMSLLVKDDMKWISINQRLRAKGACPGSFDRRRIQHWPRY